MCAHVFVVRCHVETFLAEDGDRVCSHRDGSVAAVAHRQVVMDCDEHTSRIMFQILLVVSSHMRTRFKNWSAHGKPTNILATTPCDQL